MGRTSLTGVGKRLPLTVGKPTGCHKEACTLPMEECITLLGCGCEDSWSQFLPFSPRAGNGV